MTLAAPGRGRVSAGAGRATWLRRLAVTAVLLAVPLALVAANGTRDWNALGTGSRMQIGFETHTRRALDAGMLPLWNPYHLGGRPHMADPATLAAYPPHVVLRGLLPLDTFFSVSFVIHAWIFGAGAYLLGRQLGAPVLAALAGAAGAMLGTIAAPGADLVYSMTVYSSAWLPSIVALAMRAARSRSVRPPAGLVLASVMALTGPPRGQMFALAALGCCYLFAALWPGSIPRRSLARQAALLAALAGGLSAFASVPYLRLWTGAARAGGLAREDLRVRPTYDASAEADRLLASAASAAPGSRALSRCRAAADGSRFLPLGIATADGYGGAFLADYGRFANIVSDSRGPTGAAPATLVAPVRPDLLGLLNVGSIVECDGPADGPRSTADPDGVSLVHPPARLPRALWTCSPRRVTRAELDGMLKSFRYDEALTLREPNPIVHVRWAQDFAASAREEAESALNLRVRRHVDGTTWQYDLLDSRRANLAAIVGHPAVEDTAGFERGALALPAPPELPQASGTGTEWVLGMGECDDTRPAAIERVDRADGHLVATVDAPREGVVFLSETYSPGRTAWVDGSPVDALKVNYAFTAIPVAAGVHRIELRAETGSFAAGLLVTAVTSIGWIALTWMPRRQ